MADVLIVDDSNSMRQMVSFTLSRAGGYKVTEAADGRAALNIVQSKKFDLVITDLNMPNMNGLELAKALRSRPDYRFVPILMLTTESSQEIKQQGRAAGVTGWLVKPFNPEQLVAVIKKVLP